MAALTTFDLVDSTGLKPTFVAASASDTAEVGSGTNIFVVYKNTDATNTRTVTVSVPGNTKYGQPNPTSVFTLATTTGEVWIPMRKDYDQGSANPGRAVLTLAGTGSPTGVTVAVVRHL